MDYKGLINDSLLCTDSVHSNGLGVVGESVSDLQIIDSTMNMMMLGSFIFLVVALAHSREFFIRQLSVFFYETHSDEIKNYTTQEHLVQQTVIGIGSLLLSISTFFLGTRLLAPHDSFPDRITSILLILFFVVSYLIVKGTIQYVANIVFFGRRLAGYFYCIQIFISACTSILLLPIAVCLVYSIISVKILAICLVFALFLNKILTFYKTWTIFFRQNGLFLQIILYFCTLEIAPLAAAGGIWLSIFNGLK